MNDPWLALYHCLPGPARSAAATLWGWHLDRWRFGPEFEDLVVAALERDGWSAARWSAFQEERLVLALERAATRVPFYRQHWQARRRRGDRAPWSDLANWPLLGKEDVRQNPRALLADDCTPRQLYPERTSGTTGTPLQVWWGKRAVRAWFALLEARTRRWNGVARGMPWALLGGQLVTPGTASQPPFWVWNAAMQQLYLSVYHLAPANLPSYLAALERYEVRYLLGFPSAMSTLAAGALTRPTPGPTLQVAISQGEPFLPDQRRVLNQAFGAAPRETFGMAELVCAASECAQGTLHWWPEVGWTEVLTAEGQPAPAGTPGRLIATSLLNLDMPLIRYDTGNSVTPNVAATPCACGRGLPAAGTILGRHDDVLITPDGRRLGRLDSVFRADLPILQGQLVQEQPDQIRVRVVPARGYTEVHSTRLRHRVEQRVGPGIRIAIETAAQIQPGAGGKFQAVISRCAPSPTAPDPTAPRATSPPGQALRVLMVTSEWPSTAAPHAAPFILQQVTFLRRLGVHIEVLSFRGGGKLSNYLSGWWRVHQALKRNHFDLIHAQWGQSALLALPRKRPLVVTFRGSDLEGLPGRDGRPTARGRLLRLLSRWVATRADQVVAVSARLARHFPERSYHVIPSGLDLSRFHPQPQAAARQALALPPGRRLILFAASPDNPIKRYPLAQAAVALLPPELAAELIIPPGVPHERMPLYMNACDALLLTSLHEGSPNVVKEALACNLPVVSVDVGDVGPWLARVEGSVLCPDSTPETLAHGLATVLGRNSRPESAPSMRELDETRLATRMIAVYQEALRRVFFPEI